MATFDRHMPHRIFDSLHFGLGVVNADQIGYLLEYCRRVVQAGIDRRMPISDAIKSAALAFDKVISNPNSMRPYNIDKGFTDEKLRELREKSEAYLKLTYHDDPLTVITYLAEKRRGPAVAGFAKALEAIIAAETEQGGGYRRRARTHKRRRSHRRRATRSRR